MQSLAVHFAITCFVGLELRLFILFWHLADRFGHVERDGVVVPLPLTQEHLEPLVRARRPSVTTALAALAGRGLVARGARGTSWILHGDPEDEFVHLREKVAPRTVDGRADADDPRDGGPSGTAARLARQLLNRGE